jgi:hypothetical protein
LSEFLDERIEDPTPVYVRNAAHRGQNRNVDCAVDLVCVDLNKVRPIILVRALAQARRTGFLALRSGRPVVHIGGRSAIISFGRDRHNTHRDAEPFTAQKSRPFYFSALLSEQPTELTASGRREGSEDLFLPINTNLLDVRIWTWNSYPKAMRMFGGDPNFREEIEETAEQCTTTAGLDIEQALLQRASPQAGE